MVTIKTLLAIGGLALANLACVQPAQAYGGYGYGRGDGHGDSRSSDRRGGYGHPINERQARQEWRIREGLARGQLTRWEARRLEQEQAYIRHVARNARADGYLSHLELAVLETMQDVAGRHIRQEKHDDEYRRW